MKYYIRTGTNEELMVSSGAALVMLFRQRFLSPDDEIRREGSTRWRKMRDIPEYASMIQSEKTDKLQFRWIFLGVTLAAVGFVIFSLLTG